jgi:hypothetical protein
LAQDSRPEGVIGMVGMGLRVFFLAIVVLAILVVGFLLATA